MTTSQVPKSNRQFWLTHLIQWQNSDQSQASYCREHGLLQSSFSYHKHKPTAKPVSPAPSGFLQLPLSHSPAPAEPLSIHFADGMRVSGINADNICLLKQLVQVLS